jgi:hypothetical protein
MMIDEQVAAQLSLELCRRRPELTWDVRYSASSVEQLGSLGPTIVVQAKTSDGRQGMPIPYTAEDFRLSPLDSLADEIVADVDAEFGSDG